MVGSRSSLTNNPLRGGGSKSNKSVNSSSNSSNSRIGGFDGLEDASVSSSDTKHSRRMTKLTAREKFLDSLALKLRGIHQFVTTSGGVLRGAGHSTEDSRSRVMSGEYAMRESFY